MYLVTRFILVLFVAAFLSCGEQLPDSAAVREQITEAWNQLKQAWVDGDATASAACFTEDAINMRPNVEDDRGRAEIEKVFSEFLSTMTVEDITWTTEELNVYGDTAYELGTFTQSLRPQEGEPYTHRGRYFSVWKHQSDGKWKLYRFLFKNLPSP